jgi:hypothetical protein
MKINMLGHAAKNGEKSLDHSSQTTNERFALECQLRECFGRCAYTHKTHEKMAERSSKQLHRVKLSQIVLSALTAGGAVGVIFSKDSLLFQYATAILSIALLILNSYVKDLDPGQRAQKHREAASDIWSVRESYLSLLADVRDPGMSLDQLRKRRDELQAALHKIYRSAPHTDGDAYSEAQNALKNREDLTFTDAEIDAFLPTPLKRSAQ